MYTVVMSGLVLLVATWNFFKLGFSLCNAEKSLQCMGYKKKNCKKIKTYTGNVFRKNLHLKLSLNSRLNAI